MAPTNRLHEGSLKMTVRRLLDTMNIVSGFDDECVMKVSKEELNVKLVDPAHVAMIDMTMTKPFLKEISCNHKEIKIGIDVDEIKTDLKKFVHYQDKDELVELYFYETANRDRKDRLIYEVRARMTIGDYTRELPYVGTEGLSDPKIPSLSFDFKFPIKAEKIRFVCKLLSHLTDHLTICTIPKGIEFYAYDKGGKSKKDHLATFKHILEKPLTNDHFQSMYPLEYVEDFVNAVFLDDLTVEYAFQYPINISAKTEGFRVAFLLAPRIETE